MSLDSLTTQAGKKFTLLKLPYYLSDQLPYWIERSTGAIST